MFRRQRKKWLFHFGGLHVVPSHNIFHEYILCKTTLAFRKPKKTHNLWFLTPPGRVAHRAPCNSVDNKSLMLFSANWSIWICWIFSSTFTIFGGNYVIWKVPLYIPGTFGKSKLCICAHFAAKRTCFSGSKPGSEPSSVSLIRVGIFLCQC